MPRLTLASSLSVLASAISLLTACERPRPTGPLALLSQPIDRRLTLGEWRAVHPHDAIALDAREDLRRDAPDADLHRGACRVATGRLTIDDVPFERTAVFSLAEPPAGDSLPSDTIGLADRVCRLGAIVARRDARDRAEAAALADSATEQLRRNLGRPRVVATRNPSSIVGARRQWSLGATVISVSVRDSGSTIDERSGARTHDPFRVVISAVDTTPSRAPPDEQGRLDAENATGGDGQALGVLAARFLDSTIALVDVAPAAADLRAIAAHLHKFDRLDATPDSILDPGVDSVFARLVRTADDSAPTLDAHRRARLALAMDLALARYAGTVPLDAGSAGSAGSAGAKTHELLRAAGVPFEDDSADLVARYPRTWARVAFITDSTSDAGRIALDVMSANGWMFRTACRDTADGSDPVISHGEAALRAGTHDPLLHYLVAEAYQDSVAFAEGALHDYLGDRFKGRPTAQARAKAIDHFRAALAGGLEDPELRHSAWTFAVRLMLGARVPTTFICIDD